MIVYLGSIPCWILASVLIAASLLQQSGKPFRFVTKLLLMRLALRYRSFFKVKSLCFLAFLCYFQRLWLLIDSLINQQSQSKEWTTQMWISYGKFYLPVAKLLQAFSLIDKGRGRPRQHQLHRGNSVQVIPSVRWSVTSKPSTERASQRRYGCWT